jgi:hypothetical protein
MKLGRERIPFKITSTSYFWSRSFNSQKMACVQKWRVFKLLRWTQNLHKSTWDNIFYSDRPLNYKQLLIRKFLWNKKKRIWRATMSKCIFYFMETTHEQLHLEEKRSFFSSNVIDIPPSFTWIIILFNKAYKYWDGAKFWDYTGTISEPLCIEFCNFRCHILN